MNATRKTNAVIFAILFSIGVFSVARASTTDGTIDSTSKYAWGDEIGWVNFGNSGGNVHVTDSALTGYAWSENFGWINLAPTNSGVANNSEGDLSGYAWGENIGWVGFGNVSINSSGVFAGTATSSVGSIIFDCTNCAVVTDWRPASSRTSGTTPAPASIGGGSIGPTGYSAPASPDGGFRVLINGDAENVNTNIVLLSLYAGPDTVRMMVSNLPDFRDAITELYVPTKQWELAEGVAGKRTVYVKFMTQYFGASGVVSDSIMYTPGSFARVGEIGEEIKDVISSASDILRSIPSDILSKIPLESIRGLPEAIVRLFPFLQIPSPDREIEIGQIVTPEAPPPLEGRWVLIPPRPLRELVLKPLPPSIGILAQKLPEFEETLESVGVTKLNDLSKLRSVTLSIPVLSEIAKLTPISPELRKFESLTPLPIENFSFASKGLIPSEILFVRSGGGLLDVPLSLSVSDEGAVRQSVSVTAGERLTLVVKPEYPVRNIIGYLLFNSRRASSPDENGSGDISDGIDIRGKFAALYQSFFADSSLDASQLASPLLSALSQQFSGVEDRLVLFEFEYTDPDGDDIYTAEIDVPPVAGEYEIITLITYEDPDLGTKALRLMTVIDPEGYIYEESGGKQVRIPNATVSMYWKNFDGVFVLWPAEKYGQENPQVTNVSGNYAFLVPEGEYYIAVEARGYLPYQGKPFMVQKASGGVHTNIRLNSKYWWLTAVDWKTLLIFIFALLLLYNFYRDRVREAHLSGGHL